ncbi:tRNA adenosine(34) deaminase TadA [Melaminivora sp.]|uniref:tRNA adenosine(34) deaminase TadA n=1 Tax=Melaminivora sp. TaxID=1933032 RepID=UPI0028A6D974|nr:tRNA adenosine(34) deaminase TadA [Melaminivora sp.]
MIEAAQRQRDEHWMRLALAQAREALAAAEVPVGAVLVRGDTLLATGRNAPRAQCDPTAHAEIAALRAGAAALGNYRLSGCTLYVTLEPCAMCAGALLHARVDRVVYGAADPKTGVAGSVLDLFAEQRLNHQTRVQGGVLAHECTALLAQFFQARRRAHKAVHPLRDDALRTPDARFEPLAQGCHAPRYLSDLPALDRLRLHWVDAGPPGAARTWLLVHGPGQWSHALRPLVDALAGQGQRVLAPDLPGFGRSDKPKREAAHSLAWHRQVLAQFIEQLDLRGIVLLVQDAPWALALPALLPGRFAGAVSVASPLPGRASRSAVADAPYPDAGHRAGPRALARLREQGDGDEDGSAQARRFWQDWTGPAPLALGKAPAELAGARALALAPGALLTAAGAQALAAQAVPYFSPSTEQAPGA